MTLSLQTDSAIHQELAVKQYFEAFNAGDFFAVSQLFNEVGQMLPPFEEPIVGQIAIEQYLKREAAGMKAMPKTIEVEDFPGDRRQITVKGHVEALVFNVNVAWIFELDSRDRIGSVRVKLLASLQELMAYRPS